jgi:predicted oxidoreductase
MSGQANSRIIYGCMGLGGGWTKNPITQEDVRTAEGAVEAALEAGMRTFDHADIYAYGKAESVFGQVLAARPDLRETIQIQSKCGIRFPDATGGQRFDFSKAYILRAVDGILGRLGIETLDTLLLHRPDVLMEPDDVAEAFTMLRDAGKVRQFGVSNMGAAQMQFLQRSLDAPLVVNQLELSLSHRHWLDAAIHVNQDAGREVHFGEGTLEYCQMHDVQVQAWSPLSRGLYTRPLTGSEPDDVRETALLVQKLAAEFGVAPEAIVLGWLMRHPAKIQPVIGTVNPTRIRACADADRIANSLSREQWYALYISARGVALP